MEVLIKKTLIQWPGSPHHGKRKDIHIKKGLIEAIGDNLAAPKARVVNAKNSITSAGWVDMLADFCDPGYEHKETLRSGSMAAQAGGYTDVCLLPNTQPTVSNKSTVEYITQQSGVVRLHPLGSISKKIEGADLAEMGDMRLSGAIAFTDGYKPIQHAGLMLKALQYVKAFDGLLIEIPEDQSIAPHGLMHEGEVSTGLGLQGKPALAEIIQVQRGIELLEYTESRLHFSGISCKESVQLIRQAKKRGLHITCSVTPYHLLFTDASLKSYNSVYKVNPPIRTESDRKALLKGVSDGTIDAVASHHHPQHWDAKTVELAYAGMGMNTLQTVWPMLLAADPQIPAERWLTMLSTQPRTILHLEQPRLAVGEPACCTVVDDSYVWTYTPEQHQSLSNNTPFMQASLKGRVLAVINNNHICINE